jgi:sRNA-binding protein
MSSQEKPRGPCQSLEVKQELNNEDPSPAPDPSPEELVAILAWIYPECFFVYERRRKPLQVGIHISLIESSRHDLSNDEIKAALRYYVFNAEYLKKLVAGAGRVNLDGVVVGKVTLDEQHHAEGQLQWRRDRREEARRRNPNHGKPKLTLKKGRRP